MITLNLEQYKKIKAQYNSRNTAIKQFIKFLYDKEVIKKVKEGQIILLDLDYEPKEKEWLDFQKQMREYFPEGFKPGIDQPFRELGIKIEPIKKVKKDTPQGKRTRFGGIILSNQK